MKDQETERRAWNVQSLVSGSQATGAVFTGRSQELTDHSTMNQGGVFGTLLFLAQLLAMS